MYGRFPGTGFFRLPVAWTAGQRLFPDGIWAGNLTLLLPVLLFWLLRVFDTVRKVW
jgi:hypothetical protein